MQFGYFDDEAREYVITRPDTPRSWINYLGSRLYGGIISQNAGGYSFYKSGGTGRVLRRRFNGVPVDEPGRYLYLRDDASGDYWSASWQPVGKPLEECAARVRHGLGYSVFEAEYAGVRSEMTCFIPTGQAFEYWSLAVTNPGPQARTISVFSYAELANEWSYRQDLENLQYSQYVVRATCTDGMIHRTNSTRDAMSELWFGVAGADVVGFDTDRDAFLGPYRTQANPLAVERGACSGSETVGDNACASLQVRLELAPGQIRQVVFCLGVGNPDKPWRDERQGVGHAPGEASLRPGREVMAEYARPERVAAELAEIRNEWAAHLATLQVKTPDPDLNSMVNVWHAYQTLTMEFSSGSGVLTCSVARWAAHSLRISASSAATRSGRAYSAITSRPGRSEASPGAWPTPGRSSRQGLSGLPMPRQKTTCRVWPGASSSRTCSDAQALSPTVSLPEQAPRSTASGLAWVR